MSVALQVSVRESFGSAQSRRDRRAGKVPGILYGHGEPNVALMVDGDSLKSALRHHTQVVTLAGGVDQQALIRDVQYDFLGVEVLHVDFGRVSKGDRLEISVPLHLHGEAPAVKEGAVVNQVLHEIEISCPLTAVPTDLTLEIGELHADQSLHASDIPLPEGVQLVTEPERVVVTCNLPAAEPEVEETAGEPELIEKEGGEGEEEKSEGGEE